MQPKCCARRSGSRGLNFDGKTIVFGPGDGIFIPAGEKHKAKVLTNTVETILAEEI